MTRLLPGPPGDQFPAFEADPYRFLSELREHGDMVAIDLAGLDTAVIYDLDAIHRVFADKLVHIGRAVVLDRLSHATGTGILTNYEWATWHPRRRLIVRPLGSRAVGRFRDRMIDIIESQLARWPTGEEVDLNDLVRDLTLRVVADLLFTTDLTDGAVRVIERAVDEIHAWAEADPANQDTTDAPGPLRSAIAEMDDFINEVVNSRDPNNPGDDMVGLMLRAMDDEESGMDPTGVRDEAVTLILAGHETVTATVSFSLDLLGRNPDRRSAPPRWIVDETLRLYPPVHMTSKAVLADLDLGSFTVPAGWEVLIPEYVIFRDARHFERPDEFIPERWSDHSELHLDRRAYFPFLTGPKFCVGSHFALMEATELVGRFLARYDHEILDPDPPWGREFALTYAPDRAIRAILEPT